MFSRFTQLFSNPLGILYTLPGILIGLTVHEWAHAYAAYKLGDPTARNMGRMTLNPLAHIDLFGFLCLLLVGFGWAKPVPVNPRNYKNFRRDDIVVSVAGIFTNLITAFLFTFVFYLGIMKGNLGANEAFVSIFSGIVIINLSLAVFNLLPIYPLDGSHIFDSLLYRKIPGVCNFFHQYGQWILIGLLITGLLSSVLSVVVSALYSAFTSAVLAVLSLF